MMASHLVEVNELLPPQICSYIETKHYVPIKQSLKLLSSHAEAMTQTMKAEEPDAEKLNLAALLFVRLRDETEQLIRNDTIIIFPLVRNQQDVPERHRPNLPLQMVREKNKKILSLLEKLRQTANNYILKPEWTTEARLFFEELFGLEQMIQQAIYLKENVLLPRFLKLND